MSADESAHPTPPPVARTAALMHRGLGLVFLVAAVSYWTQFPGLVGTRGLMPHDALMRQAHAFPGVGFFDFPTLGWFVTGNGWMHVQCALATLGALGMLAGIVPAVSAFVAWFFYLSLVHLGQTFFGYQWDALLLEAGFLAIFLAPPVLRWRLRSATAAPSRLIFILVRWLLFRLMFASGLAKLVGGDVTWRNLTALTYHFQTQPIPNAVAWYAHQLPESVLRFMTGTALALELVPPLMLFAPRAWRAGAGIALIALQFGIAFSGNFAYFNLLSVVLCLSAFDDRHLARLPIVGRRWFAVHAESTPPPVGRAWPRWVIVPLAALILVTSTHEVMRRFGLLPRQGVPGIRTVVATTQGFNLVNNYALFVAMTTSRPEIEFEASRDGETWRPYRFKYKPDAVSKRPRQIAPFQPRLDWQLWFTAMRPCDRRSLAWRMSERLLAAEPSVLRLLDEAPFGDEPPAMVRSTLYEYRFTTSEERRETGDWWVRDGKGSYCPTMGEAAAPGARGDSTP